MNLTITDLQPRHLERMAQLEQLCFADPWGREALEFEITCDYSHWAVAEADGQVVGYAGSHLIMDEADILNVACDPALRRRGIGRAVLTALLEQLTVLGARSVTLEVREGNTPARGLYESLGFAQAGRRPGYYEKPREDALILRRALGEEAI